MPCDLKLTDLLDYTDWEREEWHAWFLEHGAPALQVSVGPHGDGRFKVVGELVRHIFSAEKRYVERLSAASLTDTTSIPVDNAGELFQFGRQSRSRLRAFIEAFPAPRWDVPLELQIMTRTLRVTPRKVIIHTVLHEIRHWGQIATLLRLAGLTAGFQDFLFSPVLDARGGAA